VVAPQHDVQGPGFLDRCRNDDLLDAALVEVWLQRIDLEEFAGAFHDEFHAQGSIIDLGEVLVLRERYDIFIIDDETIAVGSDLDAVLPDPVNGIVLCQIGRTFASTQIIDVYDLQIGIVPRIPEDETTDAAESVDSALDRHDGGRLGW